jgi:hypothetical protein
MDQGREGKEVTRKDLRMKRYTITITSFPEGDTGPFAHEEHQLILSDEEEFVGICFVYTSDPTQENILTS